MKLRPSEYCIVIMLLFLLPFVFFLHVTLSGFLSVITNFRAYGVHWLMLITGLAVAALPAYASLIRAVLTRIRALRRAILTRRSDDRFIGHIDFGLTEERLAVLSGLSILRDWLPIFIFM